MYGYSAGNVFIETGTLPASTIDLRMNAYHKFALTVEASTNDVTVWISGTLIGTFTAHYPTVGSGGYLSLNKVTENTMFQKHVLA